MLKCNGKSAHVRVSVLQPVLAVSVYPVEAGVTVTVTRGTDTLTGATNASGKVEFPLPAFGWWTASADHDGQTWTVDRLVTRSQVYNTELVIADTRVYGVEWDGTATTAWSRTDDAEGFTDPVPAVANGNGSSPFDNIMPWAGMEIVEDAQAGTLVSIPKFWYKFSKTGARLKLQVSPFPQEGFYVSPAHADRGDGAGERDVVYIGRYHCAGNYKSVAGETPKVNITRADARTGIHALGDDIWQSDFAMRLTIQMLYLVEYADWNSQEKIGYGCSASGAIANSGQTDSMTYHTGTTAASRTKYGFCQYRHIEGLWDNVFDWMDGCRYDASGLHVILNPAEFSDTEGGTLIGMPSSGYPTAFDVVEVDGVQWIIPSAAGGSQTAHVPDSWGFNASNPCLLCGGSYSQGQGYGLFCVGYGGASSASGNIGCRLMKLPKE